jgi:hypothetical protein
MLYKPYKKKNKLIQEPGVEPRIKKLLEESNVSETTRLFLKSLQTYYQEHGGLTRRQLRALKDIEFINLEKGSERHSKWAKEYLENKKPIAKICAKYYKANPPYFANLAEKILNDDKFVPVKTQYLSLCENKYAKKVLSSTFSEPVFEVGELVQGRTNAPEDIKNKIAVVVEVNERPVVRAAKGTKPYSILPVGEERSVECEERHLKKIKKS